MKDRPLDLICMGRAAVDLYSEQVGASLEKSNTFTKYVGGCAANIAIGSQRLGLKVAILSRVGDEAMGRYVRNTFVEEGVDVSHLVTDEERLTALVLLGICPPDHFPLIFYRENCADMAISEEDFSVETFKKTKALLVTGTHCSLEESYKVTLRAVELAKEAGCQVVLDIDYRPVLWGVAGHGEGELRYAEQPLVSKRLHPIIEQADLIVGTEEEFLIASVKNADAILVEKRGEKGCVIVQQGNPPIEGIPFPAEVLNVLGAGDAFMSGFLRGFLRGESLKTCAAWGNAAGAIVVTRHGCSPAMPFWEELLELTQPTFFLAFDHREGFDEKRQVKALISEAISEENGFGIIIDDEYGAAVLDAVKDKSITVARPIEQSRSFPLQWNQDLVCLKSWPTDHLVKVLCYVPPEEDPHFKTQLEALKELKEATDQSLMIELLPRSDKVSIAPMMKACYQHQVIPKWWKLPPDPKIETWEEINAIVKPYQTKVLVLGQDLLFDELSDRYLKIQQLSPYVRGMAVGRTIWREPAEAWLKGKKERRDAIDEIQQRVSKFYAIANRT